MNIQNILSQIELPKSLIRDLDKIEAEKNRGLKIKIILNDLRKHTSPENINVLHNRLMEAGHEFNPVNAKKFIMNRFMRMARDMKKTGLAPNSY